MCLLHTGDLFYFCILFISIHLGFFQPQSQIQLTHLPLCPKTQSSVRNWHFYRFLLVFHNKQVYYQSAASLSLISLSVRNFKQMYWKTSKLSYVMDRFSSWVHERTLLIASVSFNCCVYYLYFVAVGDTHSSLPSGSMNLSICSHTHTRKQTRAKGRVFVFMCVCVCVSECECVCYKYEIFWDAGGVVSLHGTRSGSEPLDFSSLPKATPPLLTFKLQPHVSPHRHAHF